LLISALLLRTFHWRKGSWTASSSNGLSGEWASPQSLFSVFYLPSFLLRQAGELMTLFAIAPFAFIPLTILLDCPYRPMDVDVGQTPGRLHHRDIFGCSVSVWCFEFQAMAFIGR
jgi:hypothetical protein